MLKRIGALSLQHSVCVAPVRPLVVRKLTQLQKLIEEAGGEVMWLEVSSFAMDSEAMLIERFNQTISEEYQEFIAECSVFTPDDAAVDYESEMKRLERRFNKIRDRDYFGCQLASLADRKLSQARIRFSCWSNTVNEKST